MNEFALIENFFANKTPSRSDVILGIGDDAAIVNILKQENLVITTDTLTAGIHFPFNTDPRDIGYKSLAVNLSDLAAMGAKPNWLTLALSLPTADEIWLGEFCKGIFELAQQYSMELIGGDLTHSPILSITVTAFGTLPQGKAIPRSGSQPGDLIYVSKKLGDAAYGLKCLENVIPAKKADYFIQKLNRPEPHIEIGMQLRDLAHSAIDISDGLAADLNHILKKSQVGAEIEIEKLPLSDELKNAVTQDEAIDLALNGGDNYGICCTIPPKNTLLIPKDLYCIGKITAAQGLKINYVDGTHYQKKMTGYQHF